MNFLFASALFAVLVRGLPADSSDFSLAPLTSDSQRSILANSKCAVSNAKFNAILDASPNGTLDTTFNGTLNTSFNATLNAAYSNTEFAVSVCNAAQLALLGPAVQKARFDAFQALADSTRGAAFSPVYKIMFKYNTYRDKISKVWGNMGEANPTRDTPQAQRIASFTCLTPASPSYQYCKRRTYTLNPTILEPVVGLSPSTSNLPPNGGDYNPWQCPVLFGNMFAVRPTGNLSSRL